MDILMAMKLDEGEARRRFAAARSAHLATADSTGAPHLVVVTFAVSGSQVVTPIDHKPKASRPEITGSKITDQLRRLSNIEANPRVSLLVDHYDDDWSRLWWVRADGIARIVTAPQPDDPAIRLLAAKYPQYVQQPPSAALILVDIATWRGWKYQ